MHGVIPVHIYILYLYHYFGNSHVLFNIQKEVYKMKGNVSFHRVMNNSSDIKQKMESVNKYSLCGVSALGFPSKNSSVRTLMFSKHASQRVVLTHGEVARIFTGAEDAYGVASTTLPGSREQSIKISICWINLIMRVVLFQKEL